MSGALYVGECPHCGSEKIQFTVWAISPSRLARHGDGCWNVHTSCNGCTGPLALVVKSYRGQPWGERERVVITDGAEDVVVLARFPCPAPDTAPADVPDRIAAAYLEALDDLKRKRWETCAMLCGKALDLATQRLQPDGGSFWVRINALRDEGAITPAMADWAHLVRVQRNESVHTEDVTTEGQARELMGFTEMFLLYAFTLPAMVRQRRQGG
jgi:hypothetical protein